MCSSDLAEFLDMNDVGEGIRIVLVQADPVIERRFLHGIAAGDPVHQDMTTEAIHLFADPVTEAVHDQEGDNHRAQSNADADDGNAMNYGRESCRFAGNAS